MELNDAIRVRYEHDGKTFEILADPNAYQQYLKGEESNINRVLFTPDVYKDLQTAERPAEDDFESAFGTHDFNSIIEYILQHGDAQLTTEQRNTLREEKKKQIVTHVARMAKDPRTDAPHPVERVENAFDEVNVTVDPLRSAEKQIDHVTERLKKVLPLSFEKKTVAIKIPMGYAGKCYGTVKNKATVLDEEWQEEYLFLKADLPAGMESELMEQLGKMTQGEVEFVDTQ